MADLTAYYRDYSDESLNDHRRAILCEQERRANLAAIPDQVRALAQTYREGGGDETALTDAITEN